MTDIDLTPFGFTPTENLAYRALIEAGPTGGYALAKKLNIARANAYQALNGLVKKSGAIATDERPQRYRAIRPEALFARLIDAESRKIDRLEAQVFSASEIGGEHLVAVEGRRALVDVALRTAARADSLVTGLGPGDLLAALAPAWRRREADGRETTLWQIGDGPGRVPIAVRGSIEADRCREFFGAAGFFLLTSELAIAARIDGERVTGYWTSEGLVVGLIRSAVHLLIAS
jgi:sugar-specific transcriptional regulator TrmB